MRRFWESPLINNKDASDNISLNKEMLSIEMARESDIDSVKQLELESGLSSWTLNDYIQEVERSDSIFLIVKKEGRIIGFLLARLIIKYPNDLSSAPANEIEIYNIAIEKKSQSISIGTTLLDKLIQIGQKNNTGKINLEVRKSNINALSFYKKNNFEVVGVRKNFYSNPTEDAILMTRNLTL